MPSLTDQGQSSLFDMISHTDIECPAPQDAKKEPMFHDDDDYESRKKTATCGYLNIWPHLSHVDDDDYEIDPEIFSSLMLLSSNLATQCESSDARHGFFEPAWRSHHKESLGSPPDDDQTTARASDFQSASFSQPAPVKRFYRKLIRLPKYRTSHDCMRSGDAISRLPSNHSTFKSYRESLTAIFDVFDSPRESLTAQFSAFNSSRESLTARFDPASHRRLWYSDGGFHQDAFSLDETTATIHGLRNLHSSVVHIQRLLNITQLLVILNSKRVDEQPHFNRPRLTETFLAITSQAALTMLTIRTSNSTDFSQNATVLFCSAVAFNVIGFLSCLFAILLCGRKSGVPARIVTGTGFVFTAYGFLAIMGMLLNDKIMLWVTGFACVACFPALASAFIK